LPFLQFILLHQVWFFISPDNFHIDLWHRHRHATAHQCAKPATSLAPTGSKAKAQAAKVLENIQKNKPATSSKNPEKQAKYRAIQLMKMRRTAEPADPKDKDRNVPLNERLFIVLNHNDTSKPFWLRKVSWLRSSLEYISIVLGRWCGKGAGFAGIKKRHLCNFSMVSFTLHQTAFHKVSSFLWCYCPKERR
jgi:hypothetical protein